MAASGAGASTPVKGKTSASSPAKSKGVGMSDRIAVTCRFRPLNKKELKLSAKTCVYMPKGNTQQVVLNTLDKAQYKFNFDGVFPSESTQVDVYEASAKPVVDAVFEGYNGCVLAYGQTGAGKSHTMSGPDTSDDELQGVIPRVAADVFSHAMEADESIEFSVECSFVEIYLEKIRDLLDSSKTNLPVREDPKLGVYVQDATTVSVISAEEMLMVMQQGDSNRAVAATGMNEGSSRSHSLFSINITQTNTESGEIRRSRLVLVDLAGSEMAKKTGVTGKQMEEAQNINRSLSALGNVINALTDGKSTHVPYRDSKLTRVLQESIGGNSRTSLVICASPSSYNEMETLSTLRFGKRAKSIKNKAKVNRERSPEEMKKIIAKLEAEAARRGPLLAALQEREGRWVGSVTGGTTLVGLALEDIDTMALSLDETAVRGLLKSVGRAGSSEGGEEGKGEEEDAGDAEEEAKAAIAGGGGGGSASAAPEDESGQAAGGGGGGGVAKPEGTSQDAPEAKEGEAGGGSAAAAVSTAAASSASGEEVTKLQEDVKAYRAKSQSLSKHVKMMTDLLKEASKEIKETRKKLQEAEKDATKFKQQANEREELVEKLEQLREQDRERLEAEAKEAREAAAAAVAGSAATRAAPSAEEKAAAGGGGDDGESDAAGEKTEGASEAGEESASGQAAEGASGSELAKARAAAAEAKVALEAAQAEAKASAKAAATALSQQEELEQEMGVLRETYRNAKQSNEDLRQELEGAQSMISQMTEDARKKDEEAAQAEASRQAEAEAASAAAAASAERAAAAGEAADSGASSAMPTRPSSPNLSTEAASAMVKGRHKVAVWEKQRMNADGTWVTELQEGDGPHWEQAAGSGDDEAALAAEKPGSAVNRDEIDAPEGWHWLCEWLVEKGADRRKRSQRLEATSLDEDAQADAPNPRRTDKQGWEYAPTFADMASGIISTVEPQPVRVATPEKAVRFGANAVRRRKWIRVRVQIQLPEDGNEAARQVLHLARTVDAHEAALRSITDEMQQVTAINSAYEQRIHDLTNKMAQAVLSGDLSLIGGQKRTFSRKRTIRGGGGMRRQAQVGSPASGAGGQSASAPSGGSKPEAKQSGGLLGWLSALGSGFQTKAPAPKTPDTKKAAIIALSKDAERGRVSDLQQKLDSMEDETARQAAVQHRDAMGRSPLHYAARGGSMPAVEVLVDAGADLSGIDSDGRNALHYAARRGSMDVAAWLMKRGIDPNKTDAHLLTALHQAALGRRAPMCDLLLHRGADAYALDAAGRTALDLAQRFNDKSSESVATIRLIQQWEASHPKSKAQAERAAAFSTPSKDGDGSPAGGGGAASKLTAAVRSAPAVSSPLARGAGGGSS